MTHKHNKYISHIFDDKETASIVDKWNVGIESIEFSITDNLDRLDETLISYSKRLDAISPNGLIFHGPFLDLNPITFDSKIMEVCHLRFHQVYVAARKLNAEKIVLHTGYHPDIYLLIGWADRMVDFFEKFFESHSGIPILIENVFDRDIQPFEDMFRIFRSRGFDKSQAAMCLDVGHAACYSKIMPEIWNDRLNEHITHYHLHDNKLKKDSHMALGSGFIPLENVFSSLPHDATLTIENGSFEAADKSLSYLEAIGI